MPKKYRPTKLSQAREALYEALEVCDSETAVHIDEALSFMFKERSIRVAPTRSRKVTPAIRAGVIEAFKRDKTLSQLEIANAFRINPGRVSEILNGLYDE